MHSHAYTHYRAIIHTRLHPVVTTVSSQLSAVGEACFTSFEGRRWEEGWRGAGKERQRRQGGKNHTHLEKTYYMSAMIRRLCEYRGRLRGKVVVMVNVLMGVEAGDDVYRLSPHQISAVTTT